SPGCGLAAGLHGDDRGEDAQVEEPDQRGTSDFDHRQHVIPPSAEWGRALEQIQKQPGEGARPARSSAPYLPTHKSFIWLLFPASAQREGSGNARRQRGSVGQRTTSVRPDFAAYTSWHPATACEGLRRKSIPPRSHSAGLTFPSQSRSRSSSGTSPSRASCTARKPARRNRARGNSKMNVRSSFCRRGKRMTLASCTLTRPGNSALPASPGRRGRGSPAALPG